MLLIVLGIALSLIGYTFCVYPLVVYMLARNACPIAKREDADFSVSIVIPVYNEEGVVAEKLSNCLDLDYPKEKLEIIFASDGSTDRSMEILREQAGGQVTLLDFEENRGKVAVLNEVVPKCQGELVLLTDASGIVNRDALRVMVGSFSDRNVGAVCGIYHIFKEGRTRMDSAESTYHGFEMQLRLWEGRIWTTLSGTGSLFLLRREDYQHLPPGVINEDYILPAKIALTGKRVVYEPLAHLYDRISTSLPAVFRRRVRIAYGNWQMIAYLKPLLNPTAGYLSWIFWSHKLLRMALPYLLAVLVVGTYLLSLPLFYAGLALTGMLLAVGIVGLLMDRYVKGHNPLGFLTLVFLNFAAIIVGTVKFFTRSKVRW